ncbi:phage portal protein [Sinorhizobium meliloti]|uniref:phage portal protein n=1 Tax=Rhizobium meliloti TaxID=382 RepID=UPI000FD807E7|nr:phage portal protein [Sinorhizobium meliloti]MDX1247553.1 phage portal protein [Sinorhizobium medicae]MQV80689.1 phage portal protein [Sinorhizobium meliloti]RVL26600.1 phage portal protein [Sinorhizobium meliloti]
MPGIIQQLLKPFRRSSELAREGEYREGPWVVMNPDGVLPQAWGQYWNFWQMGYDPVSGARGAVVEACVAAYAQTIAQCPGDHWKTLPNGGRERVTNSALSRILRSPNEYQSRSDFVMNLVRDLYIEGNTYHLAERNNRFEVDQLHPFDPRQSKPVISTEGGIFYELAGNNVLESQGRAREYGVAPARDVLHIKLEAKPGEPLVGIPPLRHAEMAIAAQAAIGSQLINFFGNMNRPPGVVETELNLTKAQVTELRQRLNDAWRGVDNLGGGPPILTNGLKFHGIAMSAKEAEVAEALKLTQNEIFMVYGVPPAILGLAEQGTFSSTEALMQFWLSRGLGFAINHIEVAFDQFFGLKGWPDEYVEFDTRALLRVAYKDRIEALVRGVQGGVFAPDEARNSEDLPTTPYGNEPRVQQQVVPLSAWAKTAEQPATPAAPAPPPAAEPEEPEEEKQQLDFTAFFAGMEDHDGRRPLQ